MQRDLTTLRVREQMQGNDPDMKNTADNGGYATQQPQGPRGHIEMKLDTLMSQIGTLESKIART